MPRREERALILSLTEASVAEAEGCTVWVSLIFIQQIRILSPLIHIIPSSFGPLSRRWGVGERGNTTFRAMLVL